MSTISHGAGYGLIVYDAPPEVLVPGQDEVRPSDGSRGSGRVSHGLWEPTAIVDGALVESELDAWHAIAPKSVSRTCAGLLAS